MPAARVAIDIEAPPQLVWRVLTAKEQWRYWNTFLYDRDPRVPLQRGRRLALVLRCDPSGEEKLLAPTVTWLRAERHLQWVAALPGWRRECRFELEALGPNRTRYRHQHRFCGPLARALARPASRRERPGLQRMARELKAYAERF